MERSHGVVHRGELPPLGTVFKPGRFGRMFPQLRPLLPTSDALNELGAAMRDAGPRARADARSEDNPDVPAGYTYLGQFIDHDITLDTTTLSEQPIDPQAVFNFRTPKLELDSVYGLGPSGQPYLYERDAPERFVIGKTVVGRGDPTIPAGLPNDLPRSGQGFALIGDPRNDENLLVAQLHLAFLKFHNKVVDLLASQGVPKTALFDEARRTVRWHYQWIVLNDFLPRIVDPSILTGVCDGTCPSCVFEEEPFIPVEFSVAAYRLGHSMVRQVYNHNRVFRPDGVAPASLNLLFVFSGLSGNIRGTGSELAALPSDWIIDWRRFFDLHTTETRPEQGFGLNLSRTIDPFLAAELHELPKGGGNLATRNLQRGRMMQLPSGQSVACAMRVAPMNPEDIASGPDGRIAKKHGFDRQTPLWYYILKEAQVQGKSQRLGEVGSRILSEVFVGLLAGDPESYLAQMPDWTPTLPAESPGTFTMADMLRFVDDLNPIG